MNRHEYVFCERFFDTKEEIHLYIERQAKLVKRKHSVWKEVLQEPLKQMGVILDEAFKRSKIQLPNYWEYIPSMAGFPEGWVRKIMLQTNNGKPYQYTVTEVKRLDELDDLEIRIKFPESDNPPPYEWEVHTLAMQPSREDFIWIPTDVRGEYQSTDETLRIPQAPRLSIQVSKTPLMRLRELEVDGLLEDFQQFSNPNIARQVLTSGIEQVSIALNDPSVYIEAFEPN